MLSASAATTRENPRALLARAERRAVIAAGLVTLALHTLRLAGGNTFYGLDFTRCDIGFVCAIREGLTRGDSFFMNAFIGNGTPLALAPESQLFSIVRFIALVFTPDLAASVSVVLHLALAAAATTALVLSFRVAPTIALLAGVCAALSGPVVDLTFHGMYIAGAVALPLTWVSARAALRRQVPSRARTAGHVGIALGLVFALFGGEPQACGIALGLVVLEALFAARARRREEVRERRAMLLSIAIACAAGLLIGSFPWWGTLAEVALTHREHTLAVGEALRWNIGPPQLVSMFVPGLTVVTHPSGRTLFGVLFPNTSSGWDPEPYLGPLFFVFVIVGLSARRARARLGSPVVVAVFGSLAALGSHTPFMPLVLSAVPALATFRFPAKFLVVTTFALVVIAAIGADRIARRTGAAPRALAGIALVGTVALVVVCWPSALVALDREVLSFVRQSAVVTVVVALVAGALVAVRRTRRFALGVVVLDFVLVVAQVIEVGPPLAPTRSVGDVVKTVVEKPVPVVCMTQEMHKHLYLDDVTWRRGQSRFFRSWLVNDLQACDGLSSAVPYSVLATRVHHALAPALDRGSMSAARALACDVVVSDVALDDPRAPLAVLALLDGEGVRTPPTPEDENTRARPANRVTIVPDARPEVTVARAPVLVPDEVSLVARLLSTTRASELTALVDDPLLRLSMNMLPEGAGVAGVDLSSTRSDEATLSFTGTGGAVVVWRRAFAVGWTAAQAGAALPVLRASGTSLAVVVDDVTRGPVTLRYVMPRRTEAIAALVLGLALLLAMERIARALARRPTADDASRVR